MNVLKARFRTRRDFLDAYTDEFPHGGLFCATTCPLAPADEVLVELSFPDLPNKMMLRGTIVSWRSALPRLRVRAGAVVRFDPSEQEKREFVLAAAKGDAPEATKRRHTRLPVDVSVLWRRANSTEARSAHLYEISVGGAQLVTEQALALDEDILLELTAPGGAHSFEIAGKVTNIMQSGYGLRFVYRDGGGSRRLKEVIRRIIAD